MTHLVYFVVGLIAGIISFIVANKCKNKPNFGNLRLDDSDPSEKPYVFLELTVPFSELEHSTYAMFKIVKGSYLDTPK